VTIGVENIEEADELELEDIELVSGVNSFSGSVSFSSFKSNDREAFSQNRSI